MDLKGSRLISVSVSSCFFFSFLNWNDPCFLNLNFISLEVLLVFAHVINTILFSSPRVDKIIVQFVLILEKSVRLGSLKGQKLPSKEDKCNYH